MDYRKIFFWILISSAALFTQCSSDTVLQTAEGVSKELAEYRFGQISDPEYIMSLNIPSCKDSIITGKLIIRFNMLKEGRVILDFTPGEKSLKSIKANGADCSYYFENDHIVIDKQSVVKGANTLDIEFIAGEQSLNRREDLIYTLLVPDRARTLFPCFDQPDLKAEYTLSLRIPFGWDAVANGKPASCDTISDIPSGGEKFLEFKFQKSEPVPTYLFSFVTGKLTRETFTRDKSVINIYHRENDPEKVSQCGEIADQIFSYLAWLEEYTHIPYPFAKYDIAIIPGFQYGGMEHTGATLYNDRLMFLEKSATIAEKMARSKLIAHETAHMWFGDYVTMKWFNDVWIKEVFANWFAMKIVSPQYPETDHRFLFLNSYYPSAYSEDRTAGAVPVQQELDNLKNAGLVYCNIIYNKAPIVMDILVRKVGEELFREGISEYLKKFAYSNATWDDLVDILDNLTTEDLRSWSDVWIKEPGMPDYTAVAADGKIDITLSDPAGKGRRWEQPLQYRLVGETPVPNVDGLGYGTFLLDSLQKKLIIDGFADYRDGNSSKLPLLSDDVTRLSLLITLNENMLRGKISLMDFVEILTEYLPNESNVLLFGRGVGYLVSAYTDLDSHTGLNGDVERSLWGVISGDTNPQKRTTAYRAYIRIAGSEEASNRLWSVWSEPASFAYVPLGENDIVNLSYELMLRKPGNYKEIVNLQRSRITNPDRMKAFEFIFPALSPVESVRDSVFRSLADTENRNVEPWVASSLSYLNHYTRRDSSLKYISPALELLPEIQRTGDIFFPSDWLGALLGGHNSPQALDAVNNYLDSAKELNPMLRSKVLQKADHIFRAAGRR
ncbi:MAG: M1 family aminopeptidase [Bacteroidales bacterium]|nr:M1 family aminopeptidase [Bacteroidales bacterium]MDD3989269.1 M1 family aminopeptidase [Bacteroidales bacterium]